MMARLLAVVLLVVVAVGPASVEIVRAQTPAACQPDAEPNDTPDEAVTLSGPFCLDGQLGDSDQDIVLWTVSDSDATKTWTFSLTGVPNTVTGVTVVGVTSEPGASPVVAGSTLFELSTQPDTKGAVQAADLMFKSGTYIVGVSRSGTADGSPPPSLTYHLDVAAAASPPKNGDVEPNDDASSATPVKSAFALAGDLQGSEDWYAWTLSADDAKSGWELDGRSQVGESFSLELYDANQTRITSIYADQLGRVSLYDLALNAGTYFIHVGSSADSSRPYILQTSKSARPANDLEPNDTPETASPFDLTHPVVKGRLAAENDVDFYKLVVDDQLAKAQFDVKLIWRSGNTRKLCLEDETGNTDIQCKDGTTGAALSNLFLPKGTYYLKVTGDQNLSDPYLLRLDATAAPQATFETEPNDAVDLASPLEPNTEMRGRFNGLETDNYRINVTGDPQIWQLTVDGEGLQRVEVVGADGTTLEYATVSDNGTHAQISDLFLTPGDHWFHLEGDSGDYVIKVVPTGPPDPNGEHEPNNDATNGERLDLGQTRNGRLVEQSDVDFYRFSLAAHEHIVLTIDEPTDGTVAANLSWGNTTIVKISGSQPGESLVYDADLEPGDYNIALTPVQTSEGQYHISFKRADPFLLADDQEPNNSIDQARPIPPTLSVSGTVGGETNDDDWYLLPALDTETGVTVTATFENSGSVSISDGTTPIDLTQNADGTFSGRMPAGAGYALRISGIGKYTASVAFADGPKPAPAPAAPKVTMDLKLDASTIAAYWTEGQEVDGTLTIANDGLFPLQLALDAVTSHYRVACRARPPIRHGCPVRDGDRTGQSRHSAGCLGGCAGTHHRRGTECKRRRRHRICRDHAWPRRPASETVCRLPSPIVAAGRSRRRLARAWRNDAG